MKEKFDFDFIIIHSVDNEILLLFLFQYIIIILFKF